MAHNHFTRDIKPKGVCPDCDLYHDRNEPDATIPEADIPTVTDLMSPDALAGFDPEPTEEIPVNPMAMTRVPPGTENDS